MAKSLLIAITAMAHNNVIGHNNKLPWHITQDLQFFKEQTLNKPLIMGRKTRDSFGENPLPNRPHIVISRNPYYQAKKSIICDNIDTAIEHGETLNQKSGEQEIYIIGGGHIYQQTIDKIDRLLISEIDLTINGDTFFPKFNKQNFSKKIIKTYPHLKIPFQVAQYDRLR